MRTYRNKPATGGPDPRESLVPENLHPLHAIIGWLYQIILWSVLILGAVETVHENTMRGGSPTARGRSTTTAAFHAGY